MKKSKKKTSEEKRLGERRGTERRSHRRRLKKQPAKKNLRAPTVRRAADRRSGVRRQEDTFLAKIKEFGVLEKSGAVLPPLEEEVVTDPRETVDGFETSASEDAPESTDPAPESENS
jgi:hypothetical protein